MEDYKVLGEVIQFPMGKQVKRSFRLKPVDTTGRLGKKYRYLKSPCVQFTAFSEFIIGTGIILMQVIIMSVSIQTDENYMAGGGIVFGSFLIMAAILSLTAIKELTYFWLHMAMTFNIIVVLGFLIQGFILITVILPRMINQKLHIQNGVAIIEENTEDEINALFLCICGTSISTFMAEAFGIFLAVCFSRPVFCGHKDSSNNARRKSSPSDCV